MASSIRRTWNEDIQRFLKDKLVISVKQTYDLASNIVDFHLLNSWNYKRYSYPSIRPIIILERSPKDPETPDCNPDLLFEVTHTDCLDKRLAVTLEFDNYLFTKNLSRPWGPGIMYELAIYLVVHLGVTEVIVLGWDLGKLKSPVMEHFFDQENFIKRVFRRGLLSRGYRKIAEKYLLFPDNETMNRPKIIQQEVEVIAASTKPLYRWFQQQGIDLKIVSDSSLVDPCVPRITL